MLRTREGRKADGQSLVEFALISAVFVLVVMGIFDLGRVVFHYNTLSNVAREGARYASVLHENSSGGLEVANCASVVGHMQSLGVGLDLQLGDVGVAYGKYDGSNPPLPGQRCDAGVEVRSPFKFPRDPGDSSVQNPYYVVVSATFQFQPITPLIGGVIGSGGQITLSSSASMLTIF